MAASVSECATRYVEYRNVGHVRNSALSLASGEYITMLDSDDRMKPGSIRDAVAFSKQSALICY